MKTQGNRTNVLPLYALWALRGRGGEEKNPLCQSSFLLLRMPSNVQSVVPLHRFLFGLYDYQACSVALNMDVYMHWLQDSKIAEPKHSLQIDRVRGDGVLAKEHCMYERVRRQWCEDEKTSLRLNAMCGLLLFFSKIDKDVVDPRLATTQLEEEQPFTVSLERCLSRDGNQLVSTSLGVFHHEVARIDLPRKKLN